ncbi:GntR family transcriptional regulator [Rhodospirillum sp. A1_3_36]|uniref:GntR family transcriptional regulator n=1 Tax=Rhodospirillum sp. A1_3_36 TaxID=3391666 RepID=UPI0039A5CCC7
MRSQQSRILVQLRDLILKGEFAPGERLAEIPLADRLGASRTPVKLALATLEKEGLVEASPGGGYAMRTFSRRELDDAIVVRGVLEGTAARLLAENGMTRDQRDALHACLERGDRALADDELTIDGYADYVEMNDRFHQLVVEYCGNQALKRAIDVNDALPFASASATLPMHASTGSGRRWLQITHYQHHVIVGAIEQREGTRALAAAMEHIEVARMNLRSAFERPDEMSDILPVIRLLRP